MNLSFLFSFFFFFVSLHKRPSEIEESEIFFFLVSTYAPLLDIFSLIKFFGLFMLYWHVLELGCTTARSVKVN